MSYDVIGIGNAIVDVITPVEDTFLDHMGIQKGIMQLVDKERAELLYSAMETRTETPGGSVANTLSALGSLGLKTAFIGKVRDDSLGRFYAKGMSDSGTDFPNPPVQKADSPTSRSMIFVSPDGERSMNTYLGAGADLNSNDVPSAVFSDSQLLFLEGYLFDKDDGKTAFYEASQQMRKAGGKSGISLSDPFCVERHRESFQHLIANELDFAIGNNHEWETLYQTDLESALEQASKVCKTVVCTRSSDPVVIRSNGEAIEIEVTKVKPVDTTGAGDQFAAGFLFGIATGRDLTTAGKMGVLAAADVIGHIGPQPKAKMIDVFAQNGLLS